MQYGSQTHIEATAIPLPCGWTLYFSVWREWITKDGQDKQDRDNEWMF